MKMNRNVHMVRGSNTPDFCSVLVFKSFPWKLHPISCNRYFPENFRWIWLISRSWNVTLALVQSTPPASGRSTNQSNLSEIFPQGLQLHPLLRLKQQVAATFFVVNKPKAAIMNFHMNTCTAPSLNTNNLLYQHRHKNMIINYKSRRS